MATNAELVARLYIAYYDRAPDPVGLEYWIGRLNAGVSLTDIANSFAASPEAKSTYPYFLAPNVLSPDDFLAQVYLNVFGRPIDTGAGSGLEYYGAKLAAGVSPGEVLLEIIQNAVTNTTPGNTDAAFLANKVEVGLDWATTAANSASIPGISLYNPDGSLTDSANASAHGVIDGVLPPEELRDMIQRVLRLLDPPTRAEIIARAADPGRAGEESAGSSETWASVLRTRDRRRPGLRELLRYAATDVVPLSGTGQGEQDPGLSLCLARFGGIPAVVVGQDRRIQRSHAPLGPGGLRAARRAMHLAEELQLPLVTVIDTPGAALSQTAEEGGLASEIAHCLADLATHRGATLSVLLGEGTGGGALAILPADRTLAAEHAWLSLPPEGASAIVHRDTEHPPELAEQQGVASANLLANGIVDRVVPELRDASTEIEAFCARMGDAITQELAALSLQHPDRRRIARHDRYRRIGL